MPPLRWGVLGVSESVGRRAVLPAIGASDTAELVAIAARDGDRAAAEARRFGAQRSYGSYADLLADPVVEAVYLPLPNSLHPEWTLRALASGRHVLCEKPLASSAAAARRMAAAAQAAGCVLMEAYMSAFHPRQQRVIDLVGSGALGELVSLRSAFTFTNRQPANYRWQPAMGGGALLDVGIYCLEPLVAIAGEPLSVTASQETAAGGVDASFRAELEFAGGVSGGFVASFVAPEEQTLEVVGSGARLRVERAFTAGSEDRTIELRHADGRSEHIDGGGLDPYKAMVEHFAAVVAGHAASRRPSAASVATLELLDRLRAAAQP